MHSRLSELGLPLPLGEESPPTPSPNTRETYTKIRTSTPQAPRVLPLREAVKEGGMQNEIDVYRA